MYFYDFRRFIAAFMLDLACFIELLTPLAPNYFLFIASIANVGKNISYLTASASRACIHKSFAIHENLADVTAKSGSQTILASLVGTSVGISLSSFIGNDLFHLSGVFLCCSSLGLICMYFSLNRVVINTLTLSKLDVIFYHHFDSKHDKKQVKYQEIVDFISKEIKSHVEMNNDLKIDDKTIQEVIYHHLNEHQVLEKEFLSKHMIFSIIHMILQNSVLNNNKRVNEQDQVMNIASTITNTVFTKIHDTLTSTEVLNPTQVMNQECFLSSSLMWKVDLPRLHIGSELNEAIPHNQDVQVRFLAYLLIFYDSELLIWL